jgi:uncharacterized membrane protein
VDGCNVPGAREKGLPWVDNDVVNLAAAITGALLAILLISRQG